jgi:hypothetical protein
VKQTQEWEAGDLFTVKLIDGTYAIGQVVDISIPHTASCAFFNRRNHAPVPKPAPKLTPEDIIAGATVIEAHLDRGAWEIFSRCPILLAKNKWPNEATRNKGWVGSRVYTGAILEDFLNAYYALAPWDKFYDPYYLDKILIDPSKKPSRLIYKSSDWRS